MRFEVQVVHEEKLVVYYLLCSLGVHATRLANTPGQPLESVCASYAGGSLRLLRAGESRQYTK